MEVARALRENIEDANMQLGGVTLVRYLFHLFANGVEEPALAAKDGGCIEAELASLMRYPDHPHIAKEGIDTIMRACISIHEGSSDTIASRRRLVRGLVVAAGAVECDAVDADADGADVDENLIGRRASLASGDREAF